MTCTAVLNVLVSYLLMPGALMLMIRTLMLTQLFEAA